MRYSHLICLAASALAISSLVAFPPEPVYAGWFHELTGVRTPEIIRRMDPSHPIYRRGSESCLAVMTEDDYSFRITNTTGNVIHYKINDESFRLDPNKYRNHRYPKARGSDSCHITTYPKPKIKFDYNYASGYQQRSYQIGNERQYYFNSTENGIRLSLNRVKNESFNVTSRNVLTKYRDELASELIRNGLSPQQARPFAGCAIDKISERYSIEQMRENQVSKSEVFRLISDCAEYLD